MTERQFGFVRSEAARGIEKRIQGASWFGSEMGSRLMSCPSVHALANNPAALTAIAMSNPTAVSMVSDPRVASALASTSQGSSLLGGVQSSMGGGVSP